MQKCKGSKIGKYQITFEVTDNDLEKIEDIATCCEIKNPDIYTSESLDKWFKKNIWHNFWRLWRVYG